MPRRPLHALTFLLGLWLALACLGPLGFTAAGQVRGETSELESERAALAVAVDAARMALGAPRLTRRAGLDAAAQVWSRQLLVTASPRRGAPVRAPLSAEAPARWNAASLAPEERVEEAVARWLRDPASRELLLDPTTAAMGIGVSRRADGGRLVVQVYALPSVASGR